MLYEVITKRIDGVAISTSYIVAFNAVSGATLNNTSAIDDYYYDRTYTTYEETIIVPSTEYEKSAFFWIKGSNPTAAYSYTYVLASTSHSISGTRITSYNVCYTKLLRTMTEHTLHMKRLS